MTSTATYPTISNWRIDNHRDELIQKSCYIFEHPKQLTKKTLFKMSCGLPETQGFQIEWNTAESRLHLLRPGPILTSTLLKSSQPGKRFIFF